MKKKETGTISERILDILKANPAGLDIEQIREKLTESTSIGAQQHLDRRLRSLDPDHIIDRKKVGTKTLYIYQKPRPKGDWEFENVNKVLRAKIIHRANGRCQKCGRTVADHNIVLHVDHKIPQSWGGNSIEENLEAICSTCNEGKKNYFSSFDPKLMSEIVSKESVHERIFTLLTSKLGQWVDCDLIEFVANTNDVQTDWRKRLRELRYLDLTIETRRVQTENRSISEYRMINTIKFPENASTTIRKIEKVRSKK